MPGRTPCARAPARCRPRGSARTPGSSRVVRRRRTRATQRAARQTRQRGDPRTEGEGPAVRQRVGRAGERQHHARDEPRRALQPEAGRVPAEAPLAGEQATQQVDRRRPDGRDDRRREQAPVAAEHAGHEPRRRGQQDDRDDAGVPGADEQPAPRDGAGPEAGGATAAHLPVDLLLQRGEHAGAGDRDEQVQRRDGGVVARRERVPRRAEHDVGGEPEQEQPAADRGDTGHPPAQRPGPVHAAHGRAAVAPHPAHAVAPRLAVAPRSRRAHPAPSRPRRRGSRRTRGGCRAAQRAPVAPLCDGGVVERQRPRSVVVATGRGWRRVVTLSRGGPRRWSVMRRTRWLTLSAASDSRRDRPRSTREGPDGHDVLESDDSLLVDPECDNLRRSADREPRTRAVHSGCRRAVRRPALPQRGRDPRDLHPQGVALLRDARRGR